VPSPWDIAKRDNSTKRERRGSERERREREKREVSGRERERERERERLHSSARKDGSIVKQKQNEL